MTAALVGALQGLDVLLCEASEQVGGTTATSAGTIWVPGNRQGVEAGFTDTSQKGQQYLDAILGSEDPRGLRAKYLQTADAAIQYLESHSEVKFVTSGRHPDYLDLPGAATSGRALSPVEFDGRRLGADFDRIRAPLADFMILGGMMVNKADIRALVRRFRSARDFFHSARLVLRYGADRLRHRRGTRLVMGNALVARLFASLRQAGVRMSFGTRLERLETEGRAVVAAVCRREGSEVRLRARYGVVLATGGIGHNTVLRAKLWPAHVPSQSLAFEGDRGEGIDAARQVGGQLDVHPDSFFWQPVSVVAAASDRPRLFPHLYLDRAKPGVIAVNASGDRFTNEGASYHHFVEAMLRSKTSAPAIPAYLICDAHFVQAYGLGVIAPGTRDLAKYVKNGYVSVASTLDQLAATIGIDPVRLSSTIKQANQDALLGHDSAFGKGSTEVSRFNGDPEHLPNPCLATISVAPFCALSIWPADAATSTGLETDADGRVVDASGENIPGLYACGNDMASVMHGTYPGPGTTIGPAMVFGYLAALHVSRHPPGQPAAVGGHRL